MFFRNPKVKEPTFDERLSGLSQFGFSVSRVSGGAKVTRNGFGAVVEDMGGGAGAVGAHAGDGFP